MAQDNYAQVNGVNLYYEIHGDGEPLVLLHGGLGSASMYAPILPGLAKNRRVIAVDLQAHGHTADIDRPLRFESMADDIAALIAHLKLGRVGLMGYSLGGGTAWQVAIRHPEVVRKLVVLSAPCKRSGWYPEVLTGMSAMNAEAAKMMVGSPMHAAYMSEAPRPEDWQVLVAKTGDLLRQDYDWSREVEKIMAPVLIVIGDADSVRTSHAMELFALLGGGQRDGGWDGSGMPNSQLAILPGTTHYNAFASPFLPPVVTAFLNSPMPQYK